MSSDEQVFDFLAAAEDTGKQLDELIKSIPGEVRGALATEYRKSPWLTELPKVADSVTAAAERAEAVAESLARKAQMAGLLVCLAAIVVPLLTWGYAYWQTSLLRREQADLKDETARLEVYAASLKEETGGGVELIRYADGDIFVALPSGVTVDRKGDTKDGRFGFIYKWQP